MALSSSSVTSGTGTPAHRRSSSSAVALASWARPKTSALSRRWRKASVSVWYLCSRNCNRCSKACELSCCPSAPSGSANVKIVSALASWGPDAVSGDRTSRAASHASSRRSSWLSIWASRTPPACATADLDCCCRVGENFSDSETIIIEDSTGSDGLIDPYLCVPFSGEPLEGWILDRVGDADADRLRLR